MRYPKDHIQKTRQAILDAAGRGFRRLGFHGGGVDAVMAEAGLTAGGFYAHFKNKDALFSEFIRNDMEQAIAGPGRDAVDNHLAIMALQLWPSGGLSLSGRESL